GIPLLALDFASDLVSVENGLVLGLRHRLYQGLAAQLDVGGAADAPPRPGHLGLGYDLLQVLFTPRLYNMTGDVVSRLAIVKSIANGNLTRLAALALGYLLRRQLDLFFGRRNLRVLGSSRYGLHCQKSCSEKIKNRVARRHWTPLLRGKEG